MILFTLFVLGWTAPTVTWTVSKSEVWDACKIEGTVTGFTALSASDEWEAAVFSSNEDGNVTFG